VVYVFLNICTYISIKKDEVAMFSVHRLRRPKIVCSPSYADFRSKADTAMWLDLDHMTRGEHILEI
jgi:hypothetical protein